MADCGKMLGQDQLIKGMWEYLSLERARAKQFLKDAEKEKQEGTQAKEFLDQVKNSADTDCTPRIMRCGYYAPRRRRWGRNTK